MTPRTALLAVLALVAGVVTLVVTDGTAPTVLGVVLVLVGGVGTAAAGLLGLRTADPVRAQTAESDRDASIAGDLERASETGRWPRVIGGG